MFFTFFNDIKKLAKLSQNINFVALMLFEPLS